MSNANSTRNTIRLPVNAVQLHINGVTVNCNYFSKLKYSATEGPLLQYIAKKVVVRYKDGVNKLGCIQDSQETSISTQSINCQDVPWNITNKQIVIQV